MLFADDAGIVSKSAEALAKLMTLIVTVFETAGLTVSEKKTETMLLQTRDRTPTAPSLVAAGQRYRQTTQFLQLGGIIHENADLWLEIERRIRLMWACFKRFGPELYDRKTAPISRKACMLKAEVIESCCTGVLRGLSVRNTPPRSERCTKSSCGSSAFGADNAPTKPPSRTRKRS